MSSTTHCKIPISLPLKCPYRTGSYLIYDYLPDPNEKPTNPCPNSPLAVDTHFRDGTDLKPGLRASGSRQLDVDPFIAVLEIVAPKVQRGGKLYIVDLRQESHLFFDGWAVSWYTDKDWSNVGQSLAWIRNDEDQRAKISRGKTVQIFCIDDDSNVPTGYDEVPVELAGTEEELMKEISAKELSYQRIPVTDHCRPTHEAVQAFITLCKKVNPSDDWLHFHCHGGDGRTTTFLAMYDMFCWAKAGMKPPASLDYFVNRQCSLFPYNLKPAKLSCTANDDWKCGLAVERWKFLGCWYQWLAGGGLSGGKPFQCPDVDPRCG
jgi:hypothetical protein